MLTLKPPFFVESEGSCDGPNYIRGQPNRETPGVIMTDIQDKYIPEFELPYRNVTRYIKEVNNNWNRLDDNQRNAVRNSFQDMGLIGARESFGNSTNSPTSSPSTHLSGCINFFKSGTNAEDIKELLNILLKPTEAQKTQYGITTENVDKNKEMFYAWSLNNYPSLMCNWQTGGLLLFLILIFLCIGIAIGSCI